MKVRVDSSHAEKHSHPANLMFGHLTKNCAAEMLGAVISELVAGDHS